MTRADVAGPGTSYVTHYPGDTTMEGPGNKWANTYMEWKVTRTQSYTTDDVIAAGSRINLLACN